MTKDEALKLALEALEIRCGTNADERGPYGAITAIREALAQPEPGGVCVRCGGWVCDPIPELAQPEQEPVAWRYRMPVEDGHWVWNYATYIDDPKDQRCEPLYTTPPHRKPLTDEEIDAIYTGVRAVHHEIDSYVFARAIEAAHGIKE